VGADYRQEKMLMLLMKEDADVKRYVALQDRVSGE
jgi:hypothetical protein